MELFFDIKNTILPEVIVSAGFLCVFIFCILSRSLNKKLLFIFNIVVLLAAFLATLSPDFSFSNYIFSGMTAVCSLSFLFKQMILVGGIFAVLLSERYVQSLQKYAGEYYALLLSAILGAMLLSCSDNFVMMTVALELLGISSYLLCGFSKDDRFSVEAMMKYFVVGSVASCVVLYGISLLYGLSGSFQFEAVAQKLDAGNYIAVLGGVFVISGLCFKLAAVPFYNWASDVYRGTSFPVAAFLSVVPKVAAFGLLIRLLSVVFNNVWIIYPFVAIIAVLTMFVGNLLALREKNLRNLMAYSSIAQGGYVLCVISLGSALSISAALFYLIAYIFMNFCAWGGIGLLSEERDVTFDSVRGAVYSKPFASVCLIISVLALSGLPFSIGFFSKFYVFQSVAFAGFVLLPFLFIILINVFLSFYYYFSLVRQIVLPGYNQLSQTNGIKIKIATLFAAIFILFSGFFSFWFIDYSQKISMEYMSGIVTSENY